MSNANVNFDGSAHGRQNISGDDPLAVLQVFDRLEVGPVKLEPKRLSAPYRLFCNNHEEKYDLIYSYEEKVFAPGEPESENLADMIAVQVALNYGLFCRRMIFKGRYDESDRRFIRDMAANTAREIYVKKFLAPNPFLIGEAAHLNTIKKENYLQATIAFDQPSRRKPGDKWQLWSTDKQKHCVLSSGGKDSLLSYGLLQEIGKEVHPIFVNESGRHWFTALNAYRHFRDNFPLTARVWVNSDRAFNWMLQHMPFIRQDFSNIRSDIYPIRLWTVAVFLFAVLPLIRKRGIGRILIGNEYDTTLKARHEGIPHYDGLYDQSLYFDSALSRYFMRKGWSVSQFSVLRPLSEMLIQKILLERYPQLQQQQVSCHATHEKNGRMYPCGKCEKCRRIVGMLMALDADPGRCGYSKLQISSCLSQLARKSVSQEDAGKQQLEYMLRERGLIAVQPESGKTGKEHPEILKLRFDPKHSPMSTIPPDLRKSLYTIFLQHSNGAVRYKDKTWKSFDPLSGPDMKSRYAFEMAPESTSEQMDVSDRLSSEETCLWGELNWQDAEERLKQIDVALLAVGAIEQHGPHLPLDTDTFDADYLARRVARACSSPAPLVLPSIAYGVSYHHQDYKGTISISNDTLSRLVYDIGMSAAQNGIKKLVIINGHGGNSPALNYAAQMINRDAQIFVCVDTGETSDVDIYRLIKTLNDVHAGEFETSTSLATRPHLVKMDRARPSVPEFSSRYLNFTGKRGISWYAYTRKISPLGVMGDPTRADAEKGRKIWEIMIAHLVAFVEDLKSMTLEEIYQKRY